jgi:hypothetical protein
MSEIEARGGARNRRVVGEEEASRQDLVGEYLDSLGGRSASTVEAYGRILHSLESRVAERPGGSGGFRP